MPSPCAEQSPTGRHDPKELGPPLAFLGPTPCKSRLPSHMQSHLPFSLSKAVQRTSLTGGHRRSRKTKASDAREQDQAKDRIHLSKLGRSALIPEPPRANAVRGSSGIRWPCKTTRTRRSHGHKPTPGKCSLPRSSGEASCSEAARQQGPAAAPTIPGLRIGGKGRGDLLVLVEKPRSRILSSWRGEPQSSQSQSCATKKPQKDTCGATR